MPLLLFFLVVLSLSFKVYFKYSWRLSFCISLQTFALGSLIFVEIFGFLNRISFFECFFFWLIPTILLTLYFFRSRNSYTPLRKNLFLTYPFIWILFVVLVLSFLSGILYAPNTIDSLVYHLTRIEYWLQHKNINFFSTQTDRMLYQPPLSEYMILQFRLLQNSDTFSFIIQWIFAIGSGVAVSLIAEVAKLSRKAQYISFYVAMTIPMVILQSSSTQNDVVLSFFVLMSTYFLLKNIQKSTDMTAFFGGISIGEAILTKGTSYLLVFPICIYWGWRKLIVVYRNRRLLFVQARFILLMIVPFIAICGTFYFRNFTLIGSPLGVSKELFYVYNNQSHSLPSFLSVIIRNISLHLTVPGLHVLVEKMIFFIHEFILGVDINDLATSFTPFDLPMLGMTEDNAGNSIHFFILLPSIIFAYKSENSVLKVILFLTLGSFLLFCFQVKWQLWHSRLHTPIFLLSSVLIGAFIEKIKQSQIVIIILGISALFFAVFCFNRPIIKLPPITTSVYFSNPRTRQYYPMELEKGNQMDQLILFLVEKKYRNIAVKSDEKYGSDILYPIMYALRSISEFTPIEVNNMSSSLNTKKGGFDAILYFTPNPVERIMLDKSYEKIPLGTENIFVFKPK